MDLVNSAAFYSKNVLNVLYNTTSLIFLRMPCIINHLHDLITKSSEKYRLVNLIFASALPPPFFSNVYSTEAGSDRIG